MLAYETNAAIIYVEGNYGRDMCVLAIRTSWKTLQREDVIPKTMLMPGSTSCSRSKASCCAPSRSPSRWCRTGYACAACSPTSRTSGRPGSLPTPIRRGRIDASCILVYGLIPEANKGAIVHAPLPQAPQSGQTGRAGQPNGAAAAYGRRIGK